MKHLYLNATSAMVFDIKVLKLHQKSVVINN